MTAKNSPRTRASISIKYLLPPALIIPMFFINLLIISALVYIMYQNTYGCVYEEKMSLLQTAQGLIVDPASQELKNTTINRLAESPYMHFVRLVDLSSNSVISSAGPEHELMPDEEFPEFKNEPTSIHSVHNGSTVVEMNIKLNGGEGLWFGFEIDTIQMHFVEAVGFAIIAIILADMLFYLLAFYFFKKIFLNPFNEILKIIERLGQGDFDLKVSAKNNVLTEIEQLSDSLDKMREGFKSNQNRSEMISKLKSEFISIAAHQLRTPLSAINWVLDMIIKGDVGSINKDQNDLLDKANESNKRMISLVDDLLNVTKIEEGRFGYVFSASDMVEVIKRLIIDSSLMAKKMQVEVIFNEPKAKLPQVRLDNNKIKIAINNLIGNAIKYSKPGGKVIISAKFYKNHYIEVVIKDQGIGIPKSNLGSLFTKFFRASNAVKKQTEGSGLGLFISKNIILNHGGKIWAESKENIGSTFHFTIPTEVDLLPKKELKFEDFFQSL
ncbi:MAG: HAMP domain-containing sensor histidine kinase [bacterium]|nr:HAMP domain-containing sensor histidine kinase [bacterium]